MGREITISGVTQITESAVAERVEDRDKTVKTIIKG